MNALLPLWCGISALLTVPALPANSPKSNETAALNTYTLPNEPTTAPPETTQDTSTAGKLALTEQPREHTSFGGTGPSASHTANDSAISASTFASSGSIMTSTVASSSGQSTEDVAVSTAGEKRSTTSPWTSARPSASGGAATNAATNTSGPYYTTLSSSVRTNRSEGIGGSSSYSATTGDRSTSGAVNTKEGSAGKAATSGSATSSTSEVPDRANSIDSREKLEGSKAGVLAAVIGGFLVVMAVTVTLIYMNSRRLGPFKPGKGYSAHFSHRKRGRKQDREAIYNDLFEEE